jgi:hypothetical protein
MKTQDKCPICGKDLCNKESHIIPAMYYKPIWERGKEFLIGFDDKQGRTHYIGSDNSMNRIEMEDTEFHYTNREEHPHKLAEYYLICCECEDKFGKIETECTKILQDLRIPTDKEVITLENKKANTFYNLIFSMIYRISICRSSDFSHFNFSNDNQQNIIKKFVTNAFENLSIDLTASNVGLLVYRYNTDLQREINIEIEGKMQAVAAPWSFAEILLTNNQYSFVLLDFIFILYFDVSSLKEELQKETNTDFNKLNIDLLKEEEWLELNHTLKRIFANKIEFMNNLYNRL